MRVRVRAAVAADEGFVLGLVDRFGATRAAWRAWDEVVAGTRHQLGQAFRRADGDASIFIAVDAHDEPLGFAYVVTQRDFFTGEAHGHLSEIATAIDGGGAGSALMEACETWSRACGHRYLSLNVNDRNEKAQRFYERRAYVPEYRHLVRLL